MLLKRSFQKIPHKTGGWGFSIHHSSNNLNLWIHKRLPVTEFWNSQSSFLFCCLYLFKILHRPLKTRFLSLVLFLFLVICPVQLFLIYTSMFNVRYVFIFYLRMYISLYSSFTSCKYSFFHHLFEKLNVMKQGSRFWYFCRLLPTFRFKYSEWAHSAPNWKMVQSLFCFYFFCYHMYSHSHLFARWRSAKPWRSCAHLPHRHHTDDTKPRRRVVVHGGRERWKHGWTVARAGDPHPAAHRKVPWRGRHGRRRQAAPSCTVQIFRCDMTHHPKRAVCRCPRAAMWKVAG